MVLPRPEVLDRMSLEEAKDSGRPQGEEDPDEEAGVLHVTGEVGTADIESNPNDLEPPQQILNVMIFKHPHETVDATTVTPHRKNFDRVFNAEDKNTSLPKAVQFRAIVEVFYRSLTASLWSKYRPQLWHYAEIVTSGATDKPVAASVAFGTLTLLHVLWTWQAGYEWVVITEKNDFCNRPPAPPPPPNTDFAVWYLQYLLDHNNETLNEVRKFGAYSWSDSLDMGVLGGVPILDSTVFGGKDANITEWPWVISIGPVDFPGEYLYDRSGDNEIPLTTCSGSLVAPDWVITAQHCVLDLLASYWITAGTDCLPEYGGVLRPTAQVRRVDRVYHRNLGNKMDGDKYGATWPAHLVPLSLRWDRLTPIRYNSMDPTLDVALLHLERPMETTDHVRPIPLPYDLSPETLSEYFAANPEAAETLSSKEVYTGISLGPKKGRDRLKDADIPEPEDDAGGQLQFRLAGWGHVGFMEGSHMPIRPIRLQWLEALVTSIESTWPLHNPATAARPADWLPIPVPRAQMWLKFNDCFRRSRFWCMISPVHDWATTIMEGDSGGGWAWKSRRTGTFRLAGVNSGHSIGHLSPEAVGWIKQGRKFGPEGLRGITRAMKTTVPVNVDWIASMFRYYEKYEQSHVLEDVRPEETMQIRAVKDGEWVLINDDDQEKKKDVKDEAKDEA